MSCVGSSSSRFLRRLRGPPLRWPAPSRGAATRSCRGSAGPAAESAAAAGTSAEASAAGRPADRRHCRRSAGRRQADASRRRHRVRACGAAAARRPGGGGIGLPEDERGGPGGGGIGRPDRARPEGAKGWRSGGADVPAASLQPEPGPRRSGPLARGRSLRCRDGEAGGAGPCACAERRAWVGADAQRELCDGAWARRSRRRAPWVERRVPDAAPALPAASSGAQPRAGGRRRPARRPDGS